MISIYFLLVMVTIEAFALLPSDPDYLPPRIIKQPSFKEHIFKPTSTDTRDPTTKTPLTLDCEATGSLPLTYRWTKNGIPLDVPNVQGIQQINGTGTLVMTSPTQGNYQCFASNKFGTATFNSVQLKRGEDFQVFQILGRQPIPIEVEEGEPFNLKCVAPPGFPKPRVHWYHKNAQNGELVNIDSPDVTADPEGTLWFSSVASHSASEFTGTYACMSYSALFFSGNRQIGDEYYLIVTPRNSAAAAPAVEPTQQYVSPEKNTVLAGESIEFYCLFGGNPQPIIKWQKEQQPINPGGNIELYHSNKSLKILNATMADGTEYTCTVSNGVGPSTYRTFELNVHSPPYFTLEPQPVYAQPGDQVNFTCSAQGIPPPQIQWFHNGQLANFTGPNTSPIQLIGRNTIVIFNFTADNIGNYGCNASNIYGHVYKDSFATFKRFTQQLPATSDEVTAGIQPESTTEQGHILVEDSHIEADNRGHLSSKDNSTVTTLDTAITPENDTHNSEYRTSRVLNLTPPRPRGGANLTGAETTVKPDDSFNQILAHPATIGSMIAILLIIVGTLAFLVWYQRSRRQGKFSHNPNRMSAIIGGYD